MAIGRTRDIRKQSFWRKMVRQQQASGRPVAEWCREHAVNVSQFFFWRRELARRDTEPAGSSFVPVRIAEDADESQIEIILSGTRRVCIHGRVDRQTLADVVAVLEAWPC